MFKYDPSDSTDRCHGKNGAGNANCKPSTSPHSGGLMECRKCDAGKFATAKECQTCAEGKTSEEGALKCEECARIFYDLLCSTQSCMGWEQPLHAVAGQVLMYLRVLTVT